MNSLVKPIKHKKSDLRELVTYTTLQIIRRDLERFGGKAYKWQVGLPRFQYCSTNFTMEPLRGIRSVHLQLNIDK
jgi:hypothetical protein